ncbi:MAG: hypothetical protein KBT66_04100 [Amphritea sp.]|nr:hypothetical protein [Amphritea sp.]MBQ0783396.1 hypothetical protein [Amphritea sp.]
MPDQNAIARLEALTVVDKKASQTRSELEKVKKELREANTELKVLKGLNPERLKKNVAELKKKVAAKSADFDIQKKELAGSRKSLRTAKSELTASHNETDAFYVSSCKQWELFFTGFQFSSDKSDDDTTRIRCLDRETGTSVIANAVDGNKAAWSTDIGIPDEVSEAAAEQIIELKLPTAAI